MLSLTGHATTHASNLSVAAMVRQHRSDGLSKPGHDMAEPAKP